jgi:hypothetical protein
MSRNANRSMLAPMFFPGLVCRATKGPHLATNREAGPAAGHVATRRGLRHLDWPLPARSQASPAKASLSQCAWPTENVRLRIPTTHVTLAAGKCKQRMRFCMFDQPGTQARPPALTQLPGCGPADASDAKQVRPPSLAAQRSGDGGGVQAEQVIAGLCSGLGLWTGGRRSKDNMPQSRPSGSVRSSRLGPRPKNESR